MKMLAFLIFILSLKTSFTAKSVKLYTLASVPVDYNQNTNYLVDASTLYNQYSDKNTNQVKNLLYDFKLNQIPNEKNTITTEYSIVKSELLMTSSGIKSIVQEYYNQKSYFKLYNLQYTLMDDYSINEKIVISSTIGFNNLIVLACYEETEDQIDLYFFDNGFKYLDDLKVDLDDLTHIEKINLVKLNDITLLVQYEVSGLIYYSLVDVVERDILQEKTNLLSQTSDFQIAQANSFINNEINFFTCISKSDSKYLIQRYQYNKQDSVLISTNKELGFLSTVSNNSFFLRQVYFIQVVTILCYSKRCVFLVVEGQELVEKGDIQVSLYTPDYIVASADSNKITLIIFYRNNYDFYATYLEITSLENLNQFDRNCRSNQILIDEICEDCIYKCAKCSNKSTCEICEPAFRLNTNGTCELDCTPGKYDNNGICSDCSTNCVTCSDYDKCVSCTEGKVVYENGVCGKGCDSGKYPAEDETCLDCPEVCDKCSTSIECTACKVNFDSFENQLNCSHYCQNYGQYKINGICKECPTNCTTCTGQFECTSCIKAFFLYNGSCISQCPLGTLKSEDGTCVSEVDNCPSGTFKNFKNNGACTTCADKCLICSSDTACYMCDGTLNLTGLDSTTNKYHKLTVTGTASLIPKLTFQVETGKEVTTSVHIGPSKCVDDETLQRLIGVSKLKLCYIFWFIIAVFLLL